MPRSLSNARARQELIGRLERLEPDATALWGRMTAPQMLAHLADWMLMAKGDLKTADIDRPLLRYPVVKQIVIYWLPFPKGVRTAPELVSRRPLDWAIERAAVREHVEAYESVDRKSRWPDHPVFGRMGTGEWCVLGYRHMDHHLRQFGV